MALQRRRRSYSIASRIRVPNDLRQHIGRREIVKSLETTETTDARLRGAQWEGHVAALFNGLRQNAARMNREQIPTARISPQLSKMVADYVAFKQAGGKWTKKTASQLVTLFRVMTQMIGDRPVHEVTKGNMRELYRLMPQMPAHATKRYPGMVALDAIAAADADGNDERLSPNSQNDYYTHVKSLWKWAVENDYVDKSPALVLKDVDETAAWDQRPAFEP